MDLQYDKDISTQADASTDEQSLVDSALGTGETTSSLERAAGPIMECYRRCVADNKTEQRYSKRVGILNLTNQLFRIYFAVRYLRGACIQYAMGICR